MLRDYLKEALEPTVLFGMLSACLGIAVASFYVKFHIFTAMLIVIGIALANMSVNMLDDYIDYKNGIDSETVKTNFSGGSKFMVDGTLNPTNVLLLGISAFLVAAIIGIYLSASNIAVIPFVIIGGVSILLYAIYVVRVPFLAEPLVALNYMLIAVGSFVVATGSIAHLTTALFVAFPAGSVIGMALFINEIPDRKVDKRHDRKTCAALLKSNKDMSYYYIVWQFAAYFAIILGIIYGIIPFTEILVLAASPFMVICFLAIRHYSSPVKFEKYMGINALHAFLVVLLLIFGYIIVNYPPVIV